MAEIVERDQIEEVLDAIPVGVLAQDFDGNTILWNPAAERIFGWTVEEALGRYAPTVPAGSEDVCLAFRQAVLRGETVSGVRFDAIEGNGLTNSRDIAVLNTGTGTVNWRAELKTGGEGWLSLTPASGQVTPNTAGKLTIPQSQKSATAVAHGLVELTRKIHGL